MDILAGSAASIHVDFQTPTGITIPDAGTATYSLFDHVGVGMVVGQLLSVPANHNYVAIPVQATDNFISVSRKFEKRLLAVSWQAGGQTYQVIRRYRIIPMPIYTALPIDVRTYLGLNDDELRDDEVDLFEAYLRLDETLLSGVLDEALVSGTVTEQLANEAIVLTAVLKLIPSLRLRTPRDVSSGTDSFSRFTSVPDFDAIGAAAAQRLRDISNDLGVQVPIDNTPVFVVLTVPTDAITGV